MSLSIAWKEQPFNYIYDRLLFGDEDLSYIGMPETRFFDKRFQVIPYSFGKTAFVIKTDTVDRVLKIKIQTETPSLRLRPVHETQVYIKNTEQTVLLDIEEGHNFVLIEDAVTKEQSVTVVNSRRYATWLFSFAQDFYNNNQSRIDEQEAAIFSRYATRLTEPLFTNLYPLLTNVKALQMVAIRLITKTYTSKGSTDLAPSDVGTALTLNHPFFSELNKDSLEVDPARFPLETYQEFFSSKVAHLWLPNFSMIRWKTFMTFINNIDGSSLLDIDEREIIIRNNFGDTERHLFNFDLESDFFARRKFEVDIVATVQTETDINFIAPGYPLDMIVNETAPLGNCRAFLDLGIELDQDPPCHFDGEEYDVNHDGYVGMSLIDRNEGLVPWEPNELRGYDSTMFPEFGSTVTELIYEDGFHIKSVDLDHTVTSIDIPVTVGGGGFICSLDGGLFTAPQPQTDLDGGTFLAPEDDLEGGFFPIDGGTFLIPATDLNGGLFLAPDEDFDAQGFVVIC